MKRAIAISIAPNVEKKDAMLALRLFFSPVRYFKSDSVRLLERWFISYFRTKHAVSFNSGRAALYAILVCHGIGKDDEVLIQSFTCVAVPNSVIAAGAKPVYVDVTDQLVMDPKQIEKKITKKTKAIMVQHTFGIPADMDAIARIADKHKLLLIEDSAHTLGGMYEKRRLGSVGDVGFFSFGRDKAFSSVFGGMVITKNEALGKKLRNFQRSVSRPSIFWTMQQLIHPFFFWSILPIYPTIIGKLLIVLFQKLQLLSLPVAPHEKNGKFYKEEVRQMPNQLATLALTQLKRVKQFNDTRESLVKRYIEDLPSISMLQSQIKTPMPLLRFPVFIKEDALLRSSLVKYFQGRGIYVGNWYANVIDPKGASFENIKYEKGSCPNAERLAEKIINLPCYPTMRDSDVQKIIELLKKYEKNS